VIAHVYPHEAMLDALHRTGRKSVRRRALPADVMMYYVIAMALFRQVSTQEVLRCLMEGLRWVTPRLMARESGGSSISRVRSQLGPEPFVVLREMCVRPLATTSTAGAWYRSHCVAAIDGLMLTLPDEAGNREFFEVPGASRGSPAIVVDGARMRCRSALEGRIEHIIPGAKAFSGRILEAERRVGIELGFRCG